jgi:hypothetical protein
MAQFGEFEYKIIETGEIEITKYNGDDKSIIIPDYINNISVVSIADISEGDLSRESGVFENRGIETIKFPSHLRYIGSFAFSCNRFKNEYFIIPAGIKHIGDWSFCCNGFIDVVIPSTVTYIGESAFKDNRLKSIVIPENVKKIGYWAFGGNDCLIEVVIPSNVEFDRNEVFGNGLSQYYIRNGRKAGKYIRTSIYNKQWKNEDDENKKRKVKLELLENKKRILTLFNNGKNQNPELCLKAVEINGKLIKYVKNKTEDICLTAIKQNFKAVQYIDLTPEIHEKILEKFPEAIEYLKRKFIN